MTSNASDRVLNGRYRLDNQQGSGGMAVIYRGTDLELSRTVAIKILRPSLTGDESFLTRFRQEARNVANLTHPNIVTVHDVGQDGNTYYMVMEFIDGQDLKKIVRADAPLSVDRFLDLAIQICAGIGYAHRAGLVHADVKPQNILITREEKVKVTDFGIAQALAMTRPVEKQKVVWGSPHYFSPEQAQGEFPEPPADVYALGVVFFEMLSGRLPFMNADQQELAKAHIRDKPPRLLELNPRVPPQLENIVQRALSKDPTTRYRTADQMGRILIAYREQGLDPTGEPIRPATGFMPLAETSEPENDETRERSSPEPAIPETDSGAVETVEGSAANASYVDPGISQPAVPSPQPYDQTDSYYNYQTDYEPPPPPEPMRSPGYRQQESVELDIVTLILAAVALLAVFGVVILWIFVFNAYYG